MAERTISKSVFAPFAEQTFGGKNQQSVMDYFSKRQGRPTLALENRNPLF